MIYGGIYLPKINQCGVHASISGNRKYTYKIESQCLNKKRENLHQTAMEPHSILCLFGSLPGIDGNTRVLFYTRRTLVAKDSPAKAIHIKIQLMYLTIFRQVFSDIIIRYIGNLPRRFNLKTIYKIWNILPISIGGSTKKCINI